MAAIQLNFSLRTSSNAKTVHLLGSWDNYLGQLPLSKSGKPGSWKGTFRFQGATLTLGQRYWYYYIVDGYHVSHDPAVDFTVEPTTGRKLNIIDIPSATPRTANAKSTRRSSIEIPKGRPLSPSRIEHPKPSKPYASRHLREADFSTLPTVDEIASRFAEADLSDSDSDMSSCPSALSSRSGNSSPSSVSSLSDTASNCSCQRYGITRKGDRVKLDCGGTRCGNVQFDSEEDSCSSESDSDEEYRSAARSTRRQGIIVRR